MNTCGPHESVVMAAGCLHSQGIEGVQQAPGHPDAHSPRRHAAQSGRPRTDGRSHRHLTCDVTWMSSQAAFTAKDLRVITKLPGAHSPGRYAAQSGRHGRAEGHCARLKAVPFLLGLLSTPTAMPAGCLHSQGTEGDHQAPRRPGAHSPRCHAAHSGRPGRNKGLPQQKARI